MAKLNDTDGFVVHGWMVTELHLGGGDLIAFALVHQFTQSRAGIYKGNTSYLSAWTGWTEKTSRAHLANLVELGLIQEVRGRQENVPFCYYKLADDFYEKHPAKTTGSPGKNFPTDPVKISETTRKKLPGENNNIDNTIRENNNRFSFKNSLLEIGVPEDVADDWLQVRKDKKASNTRTAFNKLVSEIEKSGLSAAEVVRICAEKSWRGFQAEWLRNDPQPHTPSPRPERESITDYYKRILADINNETQDTNDAGIDNQ